MASAIVGDQRRGSTLLLVTNDDAVTQLVKYNAASYGKLVTRVTWDEVAQLEEVYEEVLADMPGPHTVDFTLLEPLDRPGVDLRIVSAFEMLPNSLKADVTFLKRPYIPLPAYFGGASKAA